MEEYYLIKKSLTDEYIALFESFIKDGKVPQIINDAKMSLFGIAKVIADAKLIDLSDEAINTKGGESWEDCNKFHKNIGGINPTPYMMGHKAALKDLKK